MSDAITAAELSLSRALMALSRARGTPREAEAQRRMQEAQAALKLAQEMPVGKDERVCCGMPMGFVNGAWLCVYGHD